MLPKQAQILRFCLKLISRSFIGDHKWTLWPGCQLPSHRHFTFSCWDKKQNKQSPPKKNANLGVWYLLVALICNRKKTSRAFGFMANHCFQLDWIKQYLGNKPFISVSELFPGWFNWVVKTHPEWEWTHHKGWNPELTKKTSIRLLLLDCRYSETSNQASGSMLSSPWWLHLQNEQNKAFLPCFYGGLQMFTFGPGYHLVWVPPIMWPSSQQVYCQRRDFVYVHTQSPNDLQTLQEQAEAALPLSLQEHSMATQCSSFPSLESYL